MWNYSPASDVRDLLSFLEIKSDLTESVSSSVAASEAGLGNSFSSLSFSIKNNMDLYN